MSHPPDPRIGAVGGTLASLAIHALIYWVIVAYGTIPDLDFDFQMPTEIELGMTDAMDAASGGGVQLPEDPAEAEEASGESADGEGEGASADAGTPRPDAGPPDAGVPDAGPPDAGPLVAEGSGEGDDDTTLPAGAQIAIRIDMARVRTSELSEDVKRLMAAIPDWQLLLEGSGIEPIDDLDRLLIASPNMQRSQMVLAGRHAHPDEGAQYIRDVVARFAEARGVEASWEQQHGVPVAPWPNEDATERVVAIVGPRHFVIARPGDLPTILAIAVAREASTDDGVEEASGPDALLSMGEGEAFSIEVEGARNFAQGRTGNVPIERIPERLHLGISEDPEHVVLKGRARYESGSSADEALTYWAAQRDRFAEAIMIGGYVRDLELQTDGRYLDLDHRLTFGRARFALGMLQGRIESMARRRARASGRSATE